MALSQAGPTIDANKITEVEEKRTVTDQVDETFELNDKIAIMERGNSDGWITSKNPVEVKQ